MKIFDSLAEVIFEKIVCRKSKKDPGIVKKLVFIEPGEEVSALYRDFYIKRIKPALLVLIAGLILAVFMKIDHAMNLNIPEGGFERNEWNGRIRKLELTAYSGDVKTDVDVKLSLRELSEDEIKDISDDFLKKLPELILGENADLDHVSYDLVLKDEYEGYPFKCTWRTSDPDLVRAFNGEVDPSKEGRVTLSVKYEFEGFENSSDMDIHVIMPSMTDEERLSEEIKKIAEASETEGKDKKEWIPPGEVLGKSIRWEVRKEDDSALIFFLALAVSVLIYMAPVKDLNASTEKKKKNMQASFPKVMREMSLYVGAGMTVRNAFKKIAEDGIKNSKGKELIYEEMYLACLEMGKGISEGECYERFGNRTELGEYMSFAGLLSQNLRRGNPGFKERLQEEACMAMKEKALKAKKSGEEAQTKMLAPMVMMLAVVMVMIMIPAMTGMNI